MRALSYDYSSLDGEALGGCGANYTQTDMLYILEGESTVRH
jgi:hypothetical protein